MVWIKNLKRQSCIFQVQYYKKKTIFNITNGYFSSFVYNFKLSSCQKPVGLLKWVIYSGVAYKNISFCEH